MNMLIVAATEGEVRKPLPDPLRGRGKCNVLITSVGMVATAYSLAKHLQTKKYDFVLQVGVCGSFNRDIPLGEVVFVTSDQYADLGAEDHDKYLDIFEMGLAKRDEFPYTDGKLVTPLLPVHKHISLRHVDGLTVNTVSGNEQTIKRLTERYGCATESMEGAAFHEVCLREHVPFAQVRAISNYVTPRDKSQWKMKDAIINLNNWLIDFVNKL